MILDLDGDGILTSNSKAGAFFDRDGNSFAEQTGWVGPDDGLLVTDSNGDGIINDGKALFGVRRSWKMAYRQRADFRHWLNWMTIRMARSTQMMQHSRNCKFGWIQTGEGYSQADELFSLDQAGVQSINLDSTIANATDAQGSSQVRVGSFEKAEGTIGQIAEYSLQRDATYAIPSEWLDVHDGIAVLPDLRAYGDVYDLYQAMVRDSSGELKSLVDSTFALGY